MKTQDLTADEKNVQKILNKLISEEWMASVMYRQFVLAACCTDERHAIKDTLIEISDDEMDDHYDKLVTYALHNGFSVPCQMRDYEKYAGDGTVRQFNGWKKNRDSGYYVDEAIKAERDAIASYEEVMNENVLPQELLQILLPIYYDELEHLENLSTMKMVYDSGAEYLYNRQ